PERGGQHRLCHESRGEAPFPIPLLSGRWLRAMERWQSRATLFSILLLRCAGAELREYSGELSAFSRQLSALSLQQIPPLRFAWIGMTSFLFGIRICSLNL